MEIISNTCDVLCNWCQHYLYYLCYHCKRILLKLSFLHPFTFVAFDIVHSSYTCIMNDLYKPLFSILLLIGYLLMAFSPTHPVLVFPGTICFTIGGVIMLFSSMQVVFQSIINKACLININYLNINSAFSLLYPPVLDLKLTQWHE